MRRPKGGFVIGLTGRYCAGKGTAAAAFVSRGYAVVDADELSHVVLAEKAARVIDEFGPAARAPDGGVDRRGLGRIVFSDPAARARLEGILYPEITARIREFVAGESHDVVINAPLLQRAGLQSLCDALVFVTAPALVRLLRAMRRDGLSLRDAWTRINAQKDVHPHAHPQLNGPAVDTYTVRNLGSVRSLERRVARLDRRLRG
jgi:dephospho-CoA kinase